MGKRINKLLHHSFRFGLKGNLRVLLCRIVGHRLNNKKDHGWCGRCRLAYEEIYSNSDNDINTISEFKNFRKNKGKAEICYKSNEPCIYDCKGLCKESY